MPSPAVVVGLHFDHLEDRNARSAWSAGMIMNRTNIIEAYDSHTPTSGGTESTGSINERVFTFMYRIFAMRESSISTEPWRNMNQTMVLEQASSSRSLEHELVETPIFLFEQFVSAVSSDVVKDTRLRSEVIRRLF